MTELKKLEKDKSERGEEWCFATDGIDWLTGEFTYKKDRLRRELRRLENRSNGFP